MSHSRRYTDAKGRVEAGRRYAPEEAIALARELAAGKDRQAVELHLRLGIDPKKADQQVRGTVALPHGSGKAPRVAAFVTPDVADEVRAAGADVVGGEELVKEIKSHERIDFEVAVAQPQMMKSLALIAKLLGQKGLMPNPKDETVTSNPVKTVTELKAGRVAFRSDETGNVHLAIGRVGFSEAQLSENFDAALEAVKKAKPSAAKGTYLQSATLSTTFGPGIPLAV